MLSENAIALFRQPVFAHVAVTDAKGRPHVTPVWVHVTDDGRLTFNTALGRFKDRYLQVGSPVAVSAVQPENPYEYVQVRGVVAERHTEGADADIDFLAHKYLGADSYPFRRPDEQRVRIIVDGTD